MLTVASPWKLASEEEELYVASSVQTSRIKYLQKCMSF